MCRGVIPDQQRRQQCCCRRTSYMRMPAATETLRLSSLPEVGMAVKESQAVFSNRLIPEPSLPMISTVLAGKAVCGSGSPWASAPKTQKPCCFQVFTVRTRFAVYSNGTQAAAPALILPMVSVSPALLRSGSTTASIPN